MRWGIRQWQTFLHLWLLRDATIRLLGDASRQTACPSFIFFITLVARPSTTFGLGARFAYVGTILDPWFHKGLVFITVIVIHTVIGSITSSNWIAAPIASLEVVF